ncbi:hypothetical protein [Candidatus Ruthturnera calyptogenae]|nr:hypothetical protein [Candidatus Ruthturnera calyptogenae]
MTIFNDLFAVSEVNFSAHDVNRLNSSVLMQDLADDYFILPQIIANYLARNKFNKIELNHEKVQ